MKGNSFKNKRVMQEFIHKFQTDQNRAKLMKEQAEAERAQMIAMREKKQQEILEKQQKLMMVGEDEETLEQESKKTEKTKDVQIKSTKKGDSRKTGDSKKTKSKK